VSDPLVSLLQRIAGGDRRAVKDLYDTYGMKLLGVVMRITGDRQDAEDVVQEVFLTIWRKAAEYDPARASPAAWLMTIARNRAIDRLRARAARPTAPAEALEPLADPHARADKTADDADTARTLGRALSGLEPRHAAVIRAAYLDGLSYHEISMREGVPVGTIKTWVFRGLRHMREGLGA
jgi:RNA polymerase sigma-70 factor (ECF subfamily)